MKLSSCILILPLLLSTGANAFDLSNCAFTGGTRTCPQFGTGLKANCDNPSGGSDVPVYLPLSTPFSSLKNVKLKVMVESGTRGDVIVVSRLAITNPNSEMRFLGSDLSAGPVCLLKFNDRNLDQRSQADYEQCRISAIENKLTALKGFFASATPEGTTAETILSTFANSSYQGRKILGLWLLFDTPHSLPQCE